MAGPLTASCLLDGNDFAAAARVHRRAGLSQGRRFFRSFCLAIMIAGTALILAASVQDARRRRPPRRRPAPPGVVLIAIGWGLVLLAPSIDAWRARRQALQFTAAQRQQDWTFDDDGLYLQTPQADAALRWDYYRRVIESRDTFLFYPTSKAYQVIPTRAFPSADAMARFAELASRHVPDYVVTEHCRHPGKPVPAGLGDF